MDAMVTAMVLLAPEWIPTCTSMLVDWFSRLTPLNSVTLARRSISERIWSTSVCRYARSVSPRVPDADSMASSRMRVRMECTSASAPSAICTTLTPSLVLRIATEVEAMSARRFSLTPRPAASSAARVIRRPDDSRA